MKKLQNISPMLMIVFSIVLLFWLIGCVHENNEFTVTFLGVGCEPENCHWIYIEPEIDYSLPQFYLEGLWGKNGSSEELSINTYAHFWAYFSGACPTCRPAVEPPMPVVRFHPFGRNSSIFFEFFLEAYDENIIKIIAFDAEGDTDNRTEVQFSAIVLNNELTVNGLEGNLRNYWDDGYVELSDFNGTYTLMSRP